MPKKSISISFMMPILSDYIFMHHKGIKTATRFLVLGGIPLGAEINEKYRRMVLCDTGLL